MTLPMSLVKDGKPRPVSGVEIHALTQERVAAWQAKCEDAKLERAAYEATLARRRTIVAAVVCTLLFVGVAQVALPHGSWPLSYTCLAILLVWCIWTVFTSLRDPYERLIAGRKK